MDRDRPRVGVAIVRAVMREGADPVIRVLRLDDVLRDEHVLGTTTSPDEAASLVRDWLHSMTGRTSQPESPQTSLPTSPRAPVDDPPVTPP